MMSPVDHLAIKLTLDGAVPLNLINELAKLLKSDIAWKAVPLTEEIASHDPHARTWEFHGGGWNIALTDFSIAEQPGRKPGDRGQSMAVSHNSGIFMGEDSYLWHLVAAWLVERIDTIKTDPTGSGKTSAPWLNRR